MGNKTTPFSRGFKKARKEKYKTQQLFADDYGVELQTVRNWEQAKNMPKLETFIELYEFFGCDADYLLDRLDVPTHELDYVCKYTGLSAAAVQTLHQLAYLREDASDILDNFSEFIVRYYSTFLARLADLKNAVESAEEMGKKVVSEAALVSKMNDLKDAAGDDDLFREVYASTFPLNDSEDPGILFQEAAKNVLEFNKGRQLFEDFERHYKDLTLQLFEFSKLCDEIPEGLFDSSAMLKRLRHIATSQRLFEIGKTL